jgi:trehalose 6-phosphate synthase/phosphatase
MREAILRGMLNADLVGFHVYDYARHFLSCCSRILGVQHEIRRGQIELDVLGRLVRVKILPVGVSEQLAISLHSQLTQRTASQLASTYSSRRLLLSIDDLDGFKGLDLKLEAFERMLESTPVPGVCLLQAINPSHTSESEQTAELRKTLHSHAERINRRFGTPDCPAIEVVERKLDSNERIALYSIASAYVLTAVRDGLNLHPYEYVFCREHVGVNSTAIVSEFVGCSPSLSGALRVNPWNTDATSEAMRKAVTMGEQERTVRHQRNYRYVSQHTCEHWARQLVNSLADVTESLPRKRNYGLGFGLNFKVVSVSEKFKRLDHDDVARAFSNCARAQRAVFLDYDGTLTSQRGCSMDIPPPAEAMNALRALTATADVTVCIVSGRDRGILDEWFHDERLALAAEHGQFIKPANSSRWQRSVEMVNSWQDVAVPIMQSYQESTDGSSVHVKESAAAWHFSDADPDFGNWQAKELTEHLLELIGSPMEVVKSSTTVEIKPRGVSKGLAVSRLLASIEQASGPVGCVVALGDDRSDEDMFTALDEFAAAPHHKTRPSAYSCTVGQKPSHASFYVDDNAEVLEILQMLASRHAQEQCRDSSAVIET